MKEAKPKSETPRRKVTQKNAMLVSLVRGEVRIIGGYIYQMKTEKGAVMTTFSDSPSYNYIHKGTYSTHQVTSKEYVVVNNRCWFYQDVDMNLEERLCAALNQLLENKKDLLAATVQKEKDTKKCISSIEREITRLEMKVCR